MGNLVRLISKPWLTCHAIMISIDRQEPETQSLYELFTVRTFRFSVASDSDGRLAEVCTGSHAACLAFP